MNDQQNIRMMNQNEQMNSMNNVMGPQMDMGINPQGFNALMFSQTFEQMKYMINDIYAFRMNDGKQLFKFY